MPRQKRRSISPLQAFKLSGSGSSRGRLELDPDGSFAVEKFRRARLWRLISRGQFVLLGCRKQCGAVFQRIDRCLFWQKCYRVFREAFDCGRGSSPCVRAGILLNGRPLEAPQSRFSSCRWKPSVHPIFAWLVSMSTPVGAVAVEPSSPPSTAPRPRKRPVRYWGQIQDHS